MKTYYFEFDGIYPVGACGIVSAKSEKTALKLAKEAAIDSGGIGDSVVLHEWNPQKPEAHIILNGDY